MEWKVWWEDWVSRNDSQYCGKQLLILCSGNGNGKGSGCANVPRVLKSNPSPLVWSVVMRLARFSVLLIYKTKRTADSPYALLDRKLSARCLDAILVYRWERYRRRSKGKKVCSYEGKYHCQIEIDLSITFDSRVYWCWYVNGNHTCILIRM